MSECPNHDNKSHDRDTVDGAEVGYVESKSVPRALELVSVLVRPLVLIVVPVGNVQIRTVTKDHVLELH